MTIKKVGIIGCGTAGTGITQVVLEAGYGVIVREMSLSISFSRLRFSPTIKTVESLSAVRRAFFLAFVVTSDSPNNSTPSIDNTPSP